MQNEISYNQTPNENEAEASSARPARKARHSPPAEAKKPTRPAVKKARKNKSKEKSRAKLTPPAEPELALFSLIADPETIAGVPTPAERADNLDSNAEVDRLRQALHAREQELDDLRRRPDPTESEATHIVAAPTAAPPPTPLNLAGNKLLDSNQAHRMAQEARQSERASRLALHAAQQARETETETDTNEAWPSRTGRSANEQSWETRPLSVQKHGLETAPAEEREAALQGAAVSRGAAALPGAAASQGAAAGMPKPSRSAQVELRAARAEARELEATLSIARDTALTQKLEIARLRSEIEESPGRAASEMAALEEAFREVLPQEETIDVEAIRIEAQNRLRAELAQEAEATKREIERLRERVALGERETEAREAERRILRETLTAREDELRDAREELVQVAQSLHEERDLIQELRASLDEERAQNATTQSLLAQLRNTLHGVPDGPGHSDSLGERRAPTRAAAARRAVVDVDVKVEVDPDSPASERELLFTQPERSISSELAPPTDAPAEVAPVESGRLFEAWQDDQIRRHFGPFGIDTTRDLVMAPLARRNPTLEHPGEILVLGIGAERWAERLAEDLIASESPPFHILLGGDGRSTRRADLQERPIDEFISATRTPESPADFEALLGETRPSVIVSRNFLSGMSDVGPWLEILRNLPRMGPGLVLLESTGIGPVAPVDAMVELGDRIWSLMPARYTREGAQAETRIESWKHAFDRMEPIPSNGLRAALRDGFDFEISAQFGFLTEPFLRSPIAENFDPEAQRDRRFLHQIADVDDRKIEAGIAPALHFVARIDGRIED